MIIAEGNRVSDSSALAPGSRIDRYEVAAVLGRNSRAITYRARDPQLGRDVVIREYFPQGLATRGPGGAVAPSSPGSADAFNDGLQRFAADGHALASLGSAPGIERLLAFLEAGGTAYIVSEFVEGETLEARVRRQPLTAAEVD